MDYKEYTAYVSSREPETLMKSIDMTCAPNSYRQSRPSRSRPSSARRHLQSCDSLVLRTLSKSDPQVLLRASRKGTHLHDPQAFNRRAVVTRQTIDNVPILPKLGCSDPTFVSRMQDHKTKGTCRMGNPHNPHKLTDRTITDALVYNTHQESSDPFVRKNGDRVRQLSADRDINKPLAQEGANRKSKELEQPAIVEPYKYTVFNIATKSSRINFRHDNKQTAVLKDSIDSDSWDSYGDFTENCNASEGNSCPKPSLYERASIAFKDFFDPCLHHKQGSYHDDDDQFSPRLDQMDSFSSDSANSDTYSFDSNPDRLRVMKNTRPHIYNVGDDDQVPFPEPSAAPGQVEDGTMTSFINWNPSRPMYLAAQPMYVQPVFYPIDDKRFGQQKIPLANMIEASLKEFANTSRPTTPMYYAANPVEILPVTSDGKTNSRSSTPVYYPIEQKTNLKTSSKPVYYTAVHQPDNIQVLDGVRNINDTSQEGLTSLNKPKPKKRGFFKKLLDCVKKNDKKQVAETPRRESINKLIVSPNGSRDRSELRKAKQSETSLLLLKKRQPKKAPKRKGSGSCRKKNSEEFEEEQELPAKESSPSILVLNVPKDRKVTLAKPNTATKKKRSAMKLRRPKPGPYKLQTIRRPTRAPQRADPQASEMELTSPSQPVYMLNQQEQSGLVTVASEQEMKKPRRQKSALKMCAGKQRDDDTTQTAGDPPYGTHEQQGYNHIQIR